MGVWPASFPSSTTARISGKSLGWGQGWATYACSVWSGFPTVDSKIHGSYFAGAVWVRGVDPGKALSSSPGQGTMARWLALLLTTEQGPDPAKAYQPRRTDEHMGATVSCDYVPGPSTCTNITPRHPQTPLHPIFIRQQTEAQHGDWSCPSSHCSVSGRTRI